MKKVEIITSALNEEKCLEELFNRLRHIFKSEVDYYFTITIFDNGSTDNTWSIIKSLAQSPDVRGIKMSRTFSLDAAYTAGLDLCEADVAIIMTSDLQDPPELIPDLLRKYEQGYDQVFVKITSRKSVPAVRRFLSGVFYRIVNKTTDNLIPKNVSDYRLMSKKSYKALNQLREQHRFIRGLSAWVGFNSTEVELERPSRFSGESSWLKTSLFSVVGHATRSIFAFSSTPLTWVSGIGFIMSAVSIIGLVVMSVIWVFGSVPFAGYGTLVGLISLGFSLTIFSIGLVAQYVGLIYDETKSRPIYIIQEDTRFDS